MKKLISLYISCFSLVILGTIWTLVRVHPTSFGVHTTDVAALVKLDPPSVALGTIDAGAVVTKTISLKNISNKTLHIRRILPSCGCTTVNQVHEIGPGQEAKLNVRYDTFNKIGEFHKIITVWFKESSNVLDIPITGNSAQVYLAPEHIMLGEVPLGQHSHFKFEVRRLNGKAIEHPIFTFAHFAQEDVKEINHRIIISGVVTATLPGEKRAEMRLDCANGPSVAVSVSYHVSGHYSLSPSVFNFGGISDGQTVRRTINITTLYPVERMRIAYCPQGVKVNMKQISNRNIEITATVQAKKLLNKKLLDSHILMYYGSECHEPVVVPTYAALLQRPLPD